MLQFRRPQNLLLIILALASVEAHAGSSDSFVEIPRDNSSAPATDLRYGGTGIGRDQAAKLRANGTDLSTLDPEINDIWQPAPLSYQPNLKFPAAGSTVTFGALINGPSIYRAQVTGEDGNPYFLVIDMNVHRSLATAALMRRLGYQMDMPQYYPKLKLKFKDLAEYESFMGHKSTGESDPPSPSDVVTVIGKAPERWVTEAHPETFEVTLQDVNLENPRVTVPRYYQGSMSPDWIIGRRASRAALIPMQLLNFGLLTDTINMFPWEAGRIDREQIVLGHPAANAFYGMGIDDGQWILRKIAQLSRPEIKTIIDAAQLPPDVAELVLEKVIARRNHLMELFQMSGRVPEASLHLDYTTRINNASVRKGEVKKELYDGHAERFTDGDPKSPLRWAEVKHFIKVELIGQVINAAAFKLNEILSFKDAKEGLVNHLTDVYTKAFDYQMAHVGEPYVIPVAAWAKPIYGMNVNASRNIVTGTFYGSDSKVQLVDNISVGASVGAFGSIDGQEWAFDKNPPQYKFFGSASIGYQRNYTHVRPLPSLAAEKKEKWTHVLVPLFMRSLGKMLDPDVLAKGDKEVKKALKEFTDELREGEVFTITDTFTLQGGPSYTIPLAALMGPLASLGPSIGVGVTGEFAVVKRLMITRRQGRIEIYDNKMNTRAIGGNVDINMWIRIARATAQAKTAVAHTDAMMLDLSPITADDMTNDKPEEGAGNGSANNTAKASVDPKLEPKELEKQRSRLLKSLNLLFRHNEVDDLKAYLPPQSLDHKLKSKLATGKLLWWSWNTYQVTHKVKITPPADPDHPFNPEDKARTLYSVQKVDLNGKDPYGFFGQVIGRASKIGGIFTSDGDLDPSSKIFGKSNKTQVSTEADITNRKEVEFAPLVTINDSHSGWYLSKDKLFKIMDAIDEEVKSLNQEASLFRRDVFNSMTQLQAYEIRSSVTLFPDGIARLERNLFEPTTRRGLLIQLMTLSETEDLRDRCQNFLEAKGIENTLEALIQVDEDDKRLFNRCIEPWMRKVMRWVRKAPKREERQEYVQWLNRTVHFLQRKASLPKLLRMVGTDQFYYRVSISGFRKGDENGDSSDNCGQDVCPASYVADTIGTVPRNPTKSPFHDFKVSTFGTEWTLLDYETYARYAGSGL